MRSMWSVKNGNAAKPLDNPISDVVRVTVQAAPTSHPVYKEKERERHIDLLSCNNTMPAHENAGGEILEGQEHG